MKKYSNLWLYAVALAITLSSCQVVGGIFKAGVWVGIVIVVLVILLILWLVGRGRS
ncbi:MAG: phosphatidate cytidylyltransferase [Flavisolibacter sp.]|jgi:hypothetical protein